MSTLNGSEMNQTEGNLTENPVSDTVTETETPSLNAEPEASGDEQEQGKDESSGKIIEKDVSTAEQRLSQRNVNKGRVETFAGSIDDLSQYHALVLSEIAQ